MSSIKQVREAGMKESQVKPEVSKTNLGTGRWETQVRGEGEESPTFHGINKEREKPQGEDRIIGKNTQNYWEGYGKSNFPGQKILSHEIELRRKSGGKKGLK